jgi:hypothetical protein
VTEAGGVAAGQGAWAGGRGGGARRGRSGIRAGGGLAAEAGVGGARRGRRGGRGGGKSDTAGKVRRGVAEVGGGAAGRSVTRRVRI